MKLAATEAYADRASAGRALARHLAELNGKNVVVLALPRGGLPVAAEVAKALRAPLDVCLVRKLGVPWHEELAMGALGEGGVRVIDRALMALEGVGEDELQQVVHRAARELERR
jgi:predicted phosphoribosyltransferase